MFVRVRPRQISGSIDNYEQKALRVALFNVEQTKDERRRTEAAAVVLHKNPQ
jgi:hypothetical protein